jgi:hypothetical protein
VEDLINEVGDICVMSIPVCTLPEIILEPSDRKSRDSLVGVPTGYGLGGKGSIPGIARFLSTALQTGSGVHPASYSAGTGNVSPGIKPQGA